MSLAKNLQPCFQSKMDNFPMDTLRQFMEVDGPTQHMIWSLCSFLSIHTFHLEVEEEHVMRTELVHCLERLAVLWLIYY